MEEYQICRDNSRSILESRDCKNREWFAGKIEAIKEIVQISEQYKQEK